MTILSTMRVTMWQNNIFELLKGANVNTCPYCNAQSVDFFAKKELNEFGYIVVWCNSCKRAHKASRVRLSIAEKTDTAIPNGLIFD